MAIEQKVPVKLSSDNWGQDVGLVATMTTKSSAGEMMGQL